MPSAAGSSLRRLRSSSLALASGFVAGLVGRLLTAGFAVLGAVIARLGVLRHEQGADTASGLGIALVLEPAFTSLQIDDEPVTL